MEVLGKSTDWNRKNIQANKLPFNIWKSMFRKLGQLFSLKNDGKLFLVLSLTHLTAKPPRQKKQVSSS